MWSTYPALPLLATQSIRPSLANSHKKCNEIDWDKKKTTLQFTQRCLAFKTVSAIAVTATTGKVKDTPASSTTVRTSDRTARTTATLDPDECWWRSRRECCTRNRRPTGAWTWTRPYVNCPLNTAARQHPDQLVYITYNNHKYILIYTILTNTYTCYYMCIYCSVTRLLNADYSLQMQCRAAVLKFQFKNSLVFIIYLTFLFLLPCIHSH